jgi:hypothetical protein
LSEAQAVDAVRGYDLCRVDGADAADALHRSLPAEWRERPPLHQLALLRADTEPSLSILSINADGSLTLSDQLNEGESIVWALRHPLASEDDMRRTLGAAVDRNFCPDFALMFSCIGRGPLFYGDEDRDLHVFRERFPDTPLLGAWGTGQIVAGDGGNRLFHHSVVSVLYRSFNV